ncbi:MAG: Maf family protein, partial [bacterium]|nr:Maf family protein [bacterium]
MDDFIFLASHSPRRRELLKLTGLKFDILPLEIDDEKYLLEGYNGDIVGQAEYIAKSKLKLAMKSNLPGTFIAADTIVVSEDGVVLGKPSNEKEAELFLDRLAGNWHTVATGVAIGKREKSEYLGGKEITDRVLVTTRVKFAPMTRAEIRE